MYSVRSVCIVKSTICTYLPKRMALPHTHTQPNSRLENYSKNVHQATVHSNTERFRWCWCSWNIFVLTKRPPFSIHRPFSLRQNNTHHVSIILVNLHEVEHVFKRTASHIIRLEISFLAFDLPFLWINSFIFAATYTRTHREKWRERVSRSAEAHKYRHKH